MKPINVPKFQGSEYGTVQEASIVFGMIEAMVAAGYPLAGAHDGEEYQETDDPIKALQSVFSVGTSHIYFRNKDTGARHWVMLIVGNGPDIISDYGQSKDGFTDALETFMATLEDEA